jgi:hypothetical protein
MNVGMIAELADPGMEYSHHAKLRGGAAQAQRWMSIGRYRLELSMSALRLLIIGLLLVAHVEVFAQTSKRTPPPIIDVHLHCFSSDPRWKERTPNPVTKQPLTATNETTHMAETLAQMRKYNIVKGMISGD